MSSSNNNELRGPPDYQIKPGGYHNAHGGDV